MANTPAVVSKALAAKATLAFRDVRLGAQSSVFVRVVTIGKRPIFITDQKQSWLGLSEQFPAKDKWLSAGFGTVRVAA